MIIEATEGREVMAARKSAIPTQKMAGKIIGKGETSYCHLEQDQDGFTIRELSQLYDVLGTDGRDTLAAWVQAKFSGETI